MVYHTFFYLQVIQSIALSDLSVTMQTQDQTFAPLTSSSSTIVTYKNPFGFPLQVIEAGEDIILSASGYDLAEVCIFSLIAFHVLNHFVPL